MNRLCYRLRPGTAVHDLGGGAAQLRAPGGAMLLLDADAMRAVALADGERTEAEIGLELTRQGQPIAPEELHEIVLRLIDGEVLEAVETESRPLEPPDWPAHRCQGCGACCQGRWVGPLEPEFVALTTSRLPALREKYPRLEGVKPFVRTAADMHTLVLNASSGQCVFLDEARRCILHLEHGPEGKPSICRMFPHIRIEDDRHTRLGVGLTCLRHFDQRLEGDPDAPAGHWEALHQALDARLLHARPAPAAESFEAALLARLEPADRPDALTVALRLLPLRPGPDPATPSLEALVRRHLFRMDELLEDSYLQEAIEQLEGPYPDRVRALRALTRAAAAGREAFKPVAGRLEAPVAEVRALVDDALRRLLYLREHHRFRSLEHAVGVVALGVWVGLALASSPREFGEHLATWMRQAETTEAVEKLFRHPDEVEAFLRRFRPLWEPRRAKRG